MKRSDAPTADVGAATVNPAMLTRPPGWHRARVALAAAEHERDRIARHLADLELADRLHHTEAARHEEEQRRHGGPLTILTPEQALRYVSAPTALIQYHPPVPPERIDEAKTALSAAEAGVAAARTDVDQLATDTWDAAGEAERIGARYVVAATRLPFGDLDLYRGAPVPPSAWSALPWAKRDALLRARLVVEVGR